MDGLTKSIVVCIFFGILALISASVGLGLELSSQGALDETLVKRFYLAWNNDDYCSATNCVECLYFRVAAFFLMVAGVVLCFFMLLLIISAHRHSFYQDYLSTSLQALSIIAFFFSWSACVSAIIVYIIGGTRQYGMQSIVIGDLIFTYLNNTTTSNDDDIVCYKVKHWIFCAAAALSLAGVVLGLISFLASVIKDNARFQAKSDITTVEDLDA